MELLRQFVDLFLHVDVHLRSLIEHYGTWTYLILFAVVFCETGLVVTPFLPGDSLLFAAGAFANPAASQGHGSLNPLALIGLLVGAAVLGDTVNYWIGHWVGPEVFRKDTGRLFKKEHLERTHRFYEKHGGKTIVLARFVPIVRTFAPFVAGIGRMHYGHFFAYNVVGGVAWVILFVGAGYSFSQVPVVRERFTLVILAIVAISVLPMVVEYARHRREAARTGA
ncbi:MAG: DedA family protein [Deltaproteobacteria bacterium]|nr:DedA family protein [Deltaproteobacteria bacterium]